MTLCCGMRNINAGAVIAAAYFPPEVMFPVMIGTLFQQLLASISTHLLEWQKQKGEAAKKVSEA
jgi:predicted Na+-dependent transporter